jgi:hypothetical protein
MDQSRAFGGEGLLVWQPQKQSRLKSCSGASLLRSDFKDSEWVEMIHEGRIAIAHQAAGRLT